jgi:hypothetical protein
MATDDPGLRLKAEGHRNEVGCLHDARLADLGALV